MKVNHNDDFDTHAVIGGQQVKAFRISQSSEFFKVLSSSLYSNKPLAVIREVLCNAWDAHIDAGIIHIPVDIKFLDNKMIIRDFGKGIDPDKMHEIYCVYGESTKSNDGMQTGGFGLGSKAPFAYSDHFTVTTNHKHKKTVYAISAGSALTNGVPDMRTMVSVPTTESGLEVSIPVKNNDDVRTFIELIRQVASLGEMNVKLNGDIVPIIPISQAQNNIFLTIKDFSKNTSKVFIRYGNVVYPLEAHEDYQHLYEKLVTNIEKIPAKYNYNQYNNSWKMIIQSKPNSISVTPSRESIQMTLTTIESVTELLVNVNKHFYIEGTTFNDLMLNVDREMMDQIWLEGRAPEIISKSNLSNKMGYVQKPYPEYLTNMKDIARHWCYWNREENPAFVHQRLQYRLNVLIKSRYTRYYDLIKYKKHLQYQFDKARELKKSQYLNKLFIRPIVKKLVKHPILSHKNFFLTSHGSTRANYNGTLFNPATNYYPEGYEMLDYMRGVVSLTYSKKFFAEDRKQMPIYQLFPDQRQMVYVVPRTKGHLEEAKDFFEKLGYIVIDFGSYYDANLKPEPVEYEPVVKVVSPPKPKGIYALTRHNMSNGRTTFNPRGHFRREDDVYEPLTLDRTENPEFIFKAHNLSGADYTHKFFEFGDQIGNTICDLFGSKGGVVVNEPQYKTWIGKGAQDGYIWLINRIFDELNNPRIQNYLRFNIQDINEIRYLTSIGYHSYLLRTRYDLPNRLTDNDYLYLGMYNHIKDKIGYHPNNWMKLFNKRNEDIKNIKLSPSYHRLKKLVTKNKLLDTLDLKEMISALGSKPDLKTKTFIEISIINALES